jgi:hypothetical protein
MMGWNAFREGHRRPFMLQAHCVSGRLLVNFNALQRFITSMGLRGSFVLNEDAQVVRAVSNWRLTQFELRKR